MTVLEWLLVRGLDVEIARGEMPPAWMVVAGLLLFGLGAGILAAWIVRAVYRRRAERNRPEPPSLLVDDGWLAEEGPEAPDRYRGKRRAPRSHVVPAHPEVAATQVIPRIADDVDATAVIPTQRGVR